MFAPPIKGGGGGELPAIDYWDPESVAGGGDNASWSSQPPSSSNPIKGHICGTYRWLIDTDTDAYTGQVSGAGIMYVHPIFGKYNYEYGTLCISIPKGNMNSEYGATEAWIANWNWTADEVLLDLATKFKSSPPPPTYASTLFLKLLKENLQGTNPGSTISHGPCLGKNVPVSPMNYNCN